MNLETKTNKIEKPTILHHGSLVPNIKELEPRTGHTPDEEGIPRIFAGSPVWVAVHSWDWSSDEGVDLEVTKNGGIILTLPKGFNRERLNVPVYIYTVPSDSFNLTLTEKTGETFDSRVPVCPISCDKFNSVIEAIKHFGGQVVFMD